MIFNQIESMRALTIILVLIISSNLYAQEGAIRLKNEKIAIKVGEGYEKFKDKSVLTDDLEKKKREFTVDSLKIDQLLKNLATENVQDERTRIKSGIVLLNTKMKENLKIQDSLKIQLSEEFLLNSKINVFNFSVKHSEAFFNLIYDKEGRFKALNTSKFSIGDNVGTVYTELGSGYMGPFNIKAGVLISKSFENESSTDSDTIKIKESIQQLQNGGGNFILQLEYPLMFARTKNNTAATFAKLKIRGTADVPSLGTTTNKFPGSLALGVDWYGEAGTKNNSIKFFGNFNINGIYGTNTYRDNLNINNNFLLYGQISGGIVLKENIKLSITFGTFGSEGFLRSNGPVIGGQVIH